MHSIWGPVPMKIWENLKSNEGERNKLRVQVEEKNEWQPRIFLIREKYNLHPPTNMVV